jgi:hypothetical protein
MFTQLAPVFIQSVPMSPRSALMFPQTAPGSKTLFPRSEPLISCCMRALVGEDVSHVEQGTTAACFVPGEWSIQRAEPHGPPQEAWSPPRCRYRRISSSFQLPFSSLRILKETSIQYYDLYESVSSRMKFFVVLCWDRLTFLHYNFAI